VSRRLVAVLLDPAAVSVPPPGIDPARWRHSLAEDVLEVAASLAGVEAGLVATASEAEFATSLSWPGVTVFHVDEAVPYAGFVAAAAGGYDEAAILAADVPDLPGLHVGKLFRALGGHPVAVAEGSTVGGSVAIAARLPAPQWLDGVTLEQMTVDALRALAGVPRSTASTPGWHRLRTPADIRQLDPGLEGWDATRALLSGARP
jgi:hypothetical protein